MTTGQPPLGTVIPLRPLSLTDILNGAVAYIRANPKATLGLATVVVLGSQIIALLLQVGPLSTLGGLDSAVQGDAPSPGAIAVFVAGAFAGIAVTALASLLLSGMLTVVIGRSVFGGTISIGEAWQRLRGRLPALLGLTLLQAVALGAAVVGMIAVIAAMGALGGAAAAFAVGAPMLLIALVAVVAASTFLLFAPAVIVLEHRGIVASIIRSFALVKKFFWRVLGIWILSGIVAGVIAWGVGGPFNLAGQILAAASSGPVLPALAFSAVGSAVGQIVTAPFSAGVVVLLYADSRFRAEAFDLLLATGAPGPVETTDQLWLPQYI